jgi:DNA-binding IscR family transcriptional regulator
MTDLAAENARAPTFIAGIAERQNTLRLLLENNLLELRKRGLVRVAAGQARRLWAWRGVL